MEAGNYRRRSWVLAAIFLIVSPLAALAANPVVSQPETAPGNEAGQAVQFGTIPAEATDVAIALESAILTIKHSREVKEVKVASNCPSRWNLSGGTVRQVGISTTSLGTSVRVDATGAQVILNGKVYPLPSASGGIKNLRVDNGQVIINGKALEPLSGSSVPGSCCGPDILEVTVPEGYSGNLVLVAYGSSKANLDNWPGGSVTVVLKGSSSLTSGKLSGLTKAVIDVQGKGTAEIHGLSTRVFVSSINGDGTITVEDGAAEMSNATISGAGVMTLHGRFSNLKQSVSSPGALHLND